MFLSVLYLLCLCARLFICALWSPAWKGLTSWLSFVVHNCDFVTFPLISLDRCGTWLYRFLIFAPLLPLTLFYLFLIWQFNKFLSGFAPKTLIMLQYPALRANIGFLIWTKAEYSNFIIIYTLVRNRPTSNNSEVFQIIQPVRGLVRFFVFIFKCHKLFFSCHGWRTPPCLDKKIR